MSQPREPMTTRLFRSALKLFPSWFRDLYEADMVASFEARLDDPSRIRGIASFGRVFWALVTVVPAAAAVRLDARRSDRGRLTSGWTDDVRSAARSLRRSPGWTLAALTILTLGIGGTTAVFSVLNAVLLKPLAFHEPDRLVSIWTVNLGQALPDGSSWENAEDWLRRGTTLEDVALVVRPEFTTATVTDFEDPERIHVGEVSANFFDILGVRPVAGRLFGAPDVGVDERLIVISESLWNRRFGGSLDTFDQSLTLDGSVHRIVGVAPESLVLPRRETEVWQLRDVRSVDGRSQRGNDAYWVVGRMVSSTSLEATRLDLERVAAELAVEFPDTNRDRSVRVTTLHGEIVGARLPLILWTLLGSMLLVLVIGGTNVAQLMLSRGISRRREMAVRASLGATRTRINRQLIFESALLGLVAGGGGIVIAYLGLGGLLSLIPADVPFLDAVRVDGVVLLTAVGVTAVVAPLVGLLPALASSRASSASILRSGGRGVAGGDRRTRSVLVVSEMALAVVLLAGAGLLLRSAWVLQRVDPGFDAARTLVAHVNYSTELEPADRAVAHVGLLRGLEALPGVERSGMIGQLFVERFPDQTITVVGSTTELEDALRPRLTTDEVFPGFFEALGVPLLMGRGFTAADVGDPYAPSHVIVNRAWVREFSPDQSPVGREFRWGQRTTGPTMTVVGVVADMNRTTLEDSTFPQMFVPSAPAAHDIVLRTTGDPLELLPAVREQVWRVDPSAAVSRAGPATARYSAGLAPRRLQTRMLGAFAVLATVLAALGLFAIQHEAVASRRREIGIRVALGATPRGVRGMVVRQGLMLAAIGIGVGLLGTLLLSSVTRHFLFGVGGADPLTLAGVAAVLLTVAVGASLLPARLATRVSPVEVLSGD